MAMNILVTGAAGYIGGSIVADFISRSSGPIKNARISAVVRSIEQAQKLSKLKVNVVNLDLSNAVDVAETVVRNNVDVVVHTASSLNPELAANLIKALGQRRKLSGAETYFIHSSVTTLYSAEAGWPYGATKDTDDVYAKEKELGGSHPVVQTNLLVADLAEEQGVISFNVGVPYIYGRGTGEVRRLCISFPTYIRTMIHKKAVYKFDVNGKPPATHVSDLVAFYAILVEKILLNEPIPRGKEGYYFAIAHRQNWWAIMDGFADRLYARGLIEEPTTRVWPSHEAAADSLGFPRQLITPMATSTGEMIPVNAYKLGWAPKWDESQQLESLDDEIQAVLDAEEALPSIFSTLS